MTFEGLSCGEPLGQAIFDDVCRRAVFEAIKWNITDEGRCTLSRFPLLVERSVFTQLSEWAVALDAEARVAEQELLDRPSLQDELALPWLLRLALRAAVHQRGCRYARFDFHPTVEGSFAITEGNLDVAGGFNEASGVTKLFAEHAVGAVTGGDPAASVTESLRAEVTGGTIGCLHVTNFADDHQVVRFLAKHLEEAGLVPILFGPSQLGYDDGYACAVVGTKRHRLDAIFRFLPADWLPRLDPLSMWWGALRAGRTSWMNPVTSVFTQSKRFPLVWPRLRVPLPTWKRLLPETRSPRDIDDGDWVLKPALAHEGYRVGIGGVTESSTHATIRRNARLFPWRWAAQRRFRAAAIPTPEGPRFPSIGVFVVDGRAAGLYGRLAERPLIDDKSLDTVVLIPRGS
jgi:glutathionylspermidine synthase